MNIQEAKNIRLVDFLAGFGYEPVIQRGNSVWYKSPFRTEKEASFKVDLHQSEVIPQFLMKVYLERGLLFRPKR